MHYNQKITDTHIKNISWESDKQAHATPVVRTVLEDSGSKTNEFIRFIQIQHDLFYKFRLNKKRIFTLMFLCQEIGTDTKGKYCKS